MTLFRPGRNMLLLLNNFRFLRFSSISGFYFLCYGFPIMVSSTCSDTFTLALFLPASGEITFIKFPEA